jgi:hypothetical protein
MLGHFPVGRPDEEASSLFARAYDHAGNPSQRIFLAQLFGQANTIACLEFPCGLQHLAVSLSPGHYLTADRLISDHTRLPYYAPFLSRDQLLRFSSDMKGNGGSGLLRRVGLAVSPPRSSPFFRHCPCCDAAQNEETGERYWRRLFQLPGVDICPDHEVWLEQSSAPMRNRLNRLEYISAERSIYKTIPRTIDPSAPSYSVLVQLAKESAWLLANGLSIDGGETINERYRALLFERGLMSFRGKLLDANQLVSDFVSFYGEPLLAHLGCQVNRQSAHTWLVRLVRKSLDGMQHPLHHLLIMQWLGVTAQQFLERMLPDPPYGAGPWPCLNPVCRQNGQPIIQTCSLTYSRQTGDPVAACLCPLCGFEYRLTGSSRDRHTTALHARADQVIAFGPLWEDAFKSICQDATIPVKQKAKLLGLDAATFRQMAGIRRVQIEGPRGANSVVEPATGLPELHDGAPAAQERIHRKIWSKLVAERGAQGVTAIRKQAQSTYMWLYEHDRVWLKANSPRSGPRSRSATPRFDWHAYDIKLSMQVIEVAQRMKLLPRPRRVTLRSLSCGLNMEGQLTRHLTKLPLTLRAIDEMRESGEDFAVRRLWWAYDHFVQERVTPTRSALVKRGGLGRWLKCDSVLSALELALGTRSTSSGREDHRAA